MIDDGMQEAEERCLEMVVNILFDNLGKLFVGVVI